MIKFDPTNIQSWINKSSSKSEQLANQRNDNAQKLSPSSVVSLSGKHMTSFSLFHKTVQKQVAQFVSPNQDAKFEKIEKALLEQKEKRADAAANNIVGFIANRLKLDKADGATKEQLTSRIEAGLKGFEKGYGEANDILSDMGLLSDDVKSDIGLTEQKVRQSLYELANEYLGEEQDVIEKPIVAAPIENEPGDSDDSDSSSSVFAPSLSSFSALQSKESRGFNFELTTNDGDRVKIGVSAFLGAKFETGQFSSQQSGSGTGSSYSGSYSYSEVVKEQSFSLSISGNLDEDELKAINSLLEKINSLAADFYDGDFQKALSKAMDLGYDSSEISAFSLNLNQATSVKALQAYQSEQPILKPDVMTELKPIGKFASEIAQGLSQARDNFAHPRELLSDLFQNLDKLNKPSDLDYAVDFATFSESITENWAKRLDNIQVLNNIQPLGSGQSEGED